MSGSASTPCVKVTTILYSTAQHESQGGCWQLPEICSFGSCLAWNSDASVESQLRHTSGLRPLSFWAGFEDDMDVLSERATEKLLSHLHHAMRMKTPPGSPA